VDGFLIARNSAAIKRKCRAAVLRRGGDLANLLLKDLTMETLIKTDSNHTVELDNIRPPPHYEDTKGPQIITSDTARQGPKGRRVYVVLVVSLVAVVIALFLVARFAY
jgi:hypothetical protein